MPRTRNENTYATTHGRLVDAGLELFRSKSFDGVGINDILKKASTPKGSFYHYFKTKDEFGLAVADMYHERQMEAAKTAFDVDTSSSVASLRAFFNAAADEMRVREFSDGCLMCNLTSELADQNDVFQSKLAQHWSELTDYIAERIDPDCREQIGMAHLSSSEAANQLLNAWSGALTRMKAARNEEPLLLFMKTHFQRGE